MNRFLLFLFTVSFLVSGNSHAYLDWTDKDIANINIMIDQEGNEQKIIKEIKALEVNDHIIDAFKKYKETRDGVTVAKDSISLESAIKALNDREYQIEKHRQEMSTHLDDERLKKVGGFRDDVQLKLFKLIVRYANKAIEVASDPESGLQAKDVLRRLVADTIKESKFKEGVMGVLHSPLLSGKSSLYPNLSRLQVTDLPVSDAFDAVQDRIDSLNKQGAQPDERAQSAYDQMQHIESGWEHLPPFDAAMLEQRKYQLSEQLKPHHQRWVRKKYDDTTRSGLFVGGVPTGFAVVASGLLWYHIYQSRKRLSQLLNIPVSLVDDKKIAAAYRIEGEQAFGGGHDWAAIQVELKHIQKARRVLRRTGLLTLGLGGATGAFWLWRKLRAPGLPAA